MPAALERGGRALAHPGQAFALTLEKAIAPLDPEACVHDPPVPSTEAITLAESRAAPLRPIIATAIAHPEIFPLAQAYSGPET